MSDVSTYWQTEKRPGINKDNRKTVDYQFLLDTKLRFLAIGFDVDCFTSGTKRTVEQTKQLLREQMERYHYEYDPVRDSQKLTGKMGSDKQDDLLIATMQGLYWGLASSRDPRRLK